MPTVADVCQFLEQFAPLSFSEDWDNTGLLIGQSSQQVSRAMTCLTITEAVVEEAVSSDIGLLVSHHPLLFRGAQRITSDTMEGRMLLKLIRHDVAVYSPHTAFDSCAQGINQRLAESCGLQGIESLRPSPIDRHPGSGRTGSLAQPVTLLDFLATVREAVAARYLEFHGDSEGQVGKVAVACGSAAEFLSDAIAAGCDTFVTGEARFHAVLEAQAAGVNLILTGHYESERPAIEQLAEEIQAAVPGLHVEPSRADRNPLKLFGSPDPG